MSGNLLLRRTDLLTAEGFAAPPVTWQELVDQAAQAAAPPAYGLGLALSNLPDANVQLPVLVASIAAYAMARLRYRFKGLIGRLILFAYLTPTSLLFIPLSILMARLERGNSLRGLVLVYLTFSLPLSTWLLQGYVRRIPREIEEQATLDGLGRLGALFQIVLPLAAPGIAAVAILTFTAAWNELLLALVLITSDSQRSAPLALNDLITSDVLP